MYLVFQNVKKLVIAPKEGMFQSVDKRKVLLIKKLLHQRNISCAVGAITYYEKTTQYKYKLRYRDKMPVLGYGGTIVVDGRYGLE